MIAEVLISGVQYFAPTGGAVAGQRRRRIRRGDDAGQKKVKKPKQIK